MIAREAVVDAARTLKGTKFQHQARTPGVGIDCLGVVGIVGRTLHVAGSEDWSNDRELQAYGPSPRPDILFKKCDQYLDRVPLMLAGLGDILVMAFKVFPQHFAIVSALGPMKVIHAYPTAGAVVENGVAIAGARVLRCYRFRGVA